MQRSETADDSPADAGLSRTPAPETMKTEHVEMSQVDWNEIEFLSWDQFKQMAPSILQLEVTRLGKLLQGSTGNTDLHNGFVRARYALGRFIACIEHADKDTVEDACLEHLRAAIMSMSFQSDHMDDEMQETRRYVLVRLKYVYNRIALIY